MLSYLYPVLMLDYNKHGSDAKHTKTGGEGNHGQRLLALESKETKRLQMSDVFCAECKEPRTPDLVYIGPFND